MGAAGGPDTRYEGLVMAYDYRNPKSSIGKDLIGTENGTPSGVVLQPNGSLYFDGVNDLLDYGGFTSLEHFTSGSSISLMSFVNVKSFPDGSGQLGRSAVFSCQRYLSEAQNGGFSLEVDGISPPSGYNLKWVCQMGYTQNNGNQTSYYTPLEPYGVEYNEIHCIGWTFDSTSGTLQWYRDGIAQNSNTGINWTANSRTSPRARSGISVQGGWGNYLEMDLYTLYIWNRSLSSTEVQRHFRGIAPDLGL
jgi:hypothetical protein